MIRTVSSLAVGLLLAGCVQPVYVPPPPIQLQTYPPPVSYDTAPAYRPPTPAPLAEPLPAPTPLLEPSPTPAAGDDTGAIPLQQMPPPASSTTTNDVAPANASATQAVPRTPVAGPGSNVPLEGFRPMHSQTRPAP